ncbi:MAG: DUF4198 domain-containing protein [Paracoccaceae bacterium]
MRVLAPVLILASALFSATLAHAHEFWLSPQRYQLAEGEPIRADIRVGQMFTGAAYSYLPDRIARFDLVMGDDLTKVESRMGDRPAMAMAPPAAGLAVLVHETTDSTLTYDDWDTFLRFFQHKAFGDVEARHLARGLPKTGFSETYRRYAKSLVAVGDGAGRDRATGLEVEIVALANPYTDALPDGLPVQVLYQGAPRAERQLEVYERAPDGTVSDLRLTTDAQGRVMVPVLPGREYLLDSVVLRGTGNDDPAAGPVWHSLWASLTFKMPDRP